MTDVWWSPDDREPDPREKRHRNRDEKPLPWLEGEPRKAVAVGAGLVVGALSVAAHAALETVRAVRVAVGRAR